MNKVIYLVILITITLMQTAHVGTCAVTNNTWYIGNKFGLPKYYNITTYTNIYNEYNNIYGSIHNAHWSISSFLGYTKNQYFSFELNYSWLGQITYTNNYFNSIIKGFNVDLSTLIQYPINQKINIYTKFGGAVWHIINKNTYINDNIYCLRTNDTSLSPLIGLGLEYIYDSHLSIKLDCQKINNIGNINNIGAQANHAILSLGVLHRFS